MSPSSEAIQAATRLLDEPQWPYPTAITAPIGTGQHDDGPFAEQLVLYVELRASTLAAAARRWRQAAGTDIDAAWATLRSVEGAAAQVMQLLELVAFASHCGFESASARAGAAVNTAWEQVQQQAHALRLVTAHIYRAGIQA